MSHRSASYRLSRRRFLGTFAGSAAAAILAACGGSGSPTATAKPSGGTGATGVPAGTAASSSGKKVELTFWKHNHNPADDFTKVLIDEYQKQNPNVTIKLEIIPNDTIFTKIATAFAGGQAPDMFDLNDTTIPTYTSKGVVAPLDPSTFSFASQADLEKAYVPNSLNPFKGPDGKIYGMPFEYNSWVMTINEKMFSDAGLDPAKDYPKTWAEVGTTGAKLAKMVNGRFDRQGFGWNLLTSGWTMLQYPPIIYQLGGSVLSDDDKGKQCVLNNAEGVEALQKMQDIYYKYKAGAPGVNVSTTQDPMADFTQEKVAMWILGPWATPTFKGTPVENNYRIVPLPQASDGKRKVVSLSSWAWMVNGKSPNTAEAWKFVSYAQQQGARWLTTSGYALPRLGWTDSPEAKAFKGLDVFIEQMQYARPRLLNPNASEINDVVHKAVQQALLNNTSAKQVLDAASTDINKITSK